MKFSAVSQFLQVALESFFPSKTRLHDLPMLSPRIPELLYRAAKCFGADERARVDSSLFEYLTSGSSEKIPELIERAFTNPVVHARVVQILFAEHCTNVLFGMNSRFIEKVLEETHELIASLPSGSDWKALATPENLGWLFTHPEFSGSLFFVPNLSHSESRAFLHHPPKTGGTSIYNFLQKHALDTCQMLFPCTNFTTLTSFGAGLFHGIKQFTDLVSQPKKTVLYCGHFNLTDAVRRAGTARIRCVSLFGDPDRLLSSGLRYCLSLAASNRFFAREHGLTEDDTVILASVIRNGAYATSTIMRDVVDRMLASTGFLDQYRDPLARWYLPLGNTDFHSKVAIFESVVASMNAFVLYEQPSERCAVDLGLTVAETALLERDNVSLISSSALATLLGGDDWLKNRFRMRDLIRDSDRFYQYLLSRHTKQAF